MDRKQRTGFAPAAKSDDPFGRGPKCSNKLLLCSRKNKMPEISILMPAFDAAATVSAAVSSIVAQTHVDWELVAVDDGSTDGTPQILEEWAARDSRVRVFRNTHSGIVRALNAGLTKTKGRLIARMDADDLAAPERLELQKRFLEENPTIDVVASRVAFGGDDRASAGYAAHVEWMNQLIEPEELSLNQFVEAPIAHPSVMFRAELIDRCGGYREGTFPEDYELWLRWMDAGVKFGKVPETLLVWNDPPMRLSRNHERYSAEAFYRVKSTYLHRWLARHNPHHPRVIVFGSGRVTRRRVEMLTRLGVEVVAWVDIDPKKIGREYHGVPVIAVEDVLPAGNYFALAYVGKRGARELIGTWLGKLGYILGRDWLPAA